MSARASTLTVFVVGAVFGATLLARCGTNSANAGPGLTAQTLTAHCPRTGTDSFAVFTVNGLSPTTAPSLTALLCGSPPGSSVTIQLEDGGSALADCASMAVYTIGNQVFVPCLNTQETIILNVR